MIFKFFFFFFAASFRGEEMFLPFLSDRSLIRITLVLVDSGSGSLDLVAKGDVLHTSVTRDSIRVIIS